jgi:hypothetical protein
MHRPYNSLKRKLILAWKRFSAAVRPRRGKTLVPEGFAMVIEMPKLQTGGNIPSEGVFESNLGHDYAGIPYGVG